MSNPIGVGLLVVFLIFLLIVFAFIAQFLGLYIRAFASGSHISLFDLMGMRVRKVNALAIVNARIQASRAGINVSNREMESHVLAGGDVQRVINAMIAANKAQIELPWQIATAIDLAGRDILDAVQTSVNPKVIDVPNTTLGRTTIDGVAKDGIQLKVRARVTVRTNIKSLVGGATEETVIVRVGEGIVNAIGSAIDYKHVLENPDSISKAVLSKGLDANTAFEILSIDIADIDVGENLARSLPPTGPSLTSAASRPRPSSAARWPLRRSRKTSRMSRPTGPRWCWPRRKSPRRSPRRSAMGT